MDINNSTVVTVSQAAELLGFSRRHVIRLIQQGQFSSVFKHDGARGPWLLSRTEVEARANQNG